MRQATTSLLKESLSCFMIVGSVTEPTWKQAGQRLAMDSLMLASGLLVMSLNLFNISMHDQTEVKLAKQAPTMILGMGLGMLLFKLAALATHPCTRATPPKDTTSHKTVDDASAYHALAASEEDHTPHAQPGAAV